METPNISVKYLNKMLEKLVFEEEDLKILKLSIQQLGAGHITTKELREQIIDSRCKIIERLLEFIPFYIKQWTINQSLNEFTNSSDMDFKSELEEKLSEKDKFLEEVGKRINKIHEELKGKFGTTI